MSGRWHGPCAACQGESHAALSLVHRSQPVAGLCSACARSAPHAQAFVAQAQRLAGLVDEPGAVSITRREWGSDAISSVQFVQLIPRPLRAPGGIAAPPPGPRAHREHPDPASEVARPPRLWRRLGLALRRRLRRRA